MGNTPQNVGGYCTHSSVLFAPWHRPYLALFEQCLYASVQRKAGQFTDRTLRDRYLRAAATFRMPYWDWASRLSAGAQAFPAIFSASAVTVVDIDGSTKQVANPLQSFVFHPVNPRPGDFDSMVGAPFVSAGQV